MLELQIQGLRAGDIVFKESDGSLSNRVIRLGQFLTHITEETKIVHAGILISESQELTNTVVECTTEGLLRNDLYKTNPDKRYVVARAGDDGLAKSLASTAEMLSAGVQNNIEYTKLGALGSLIKKKSTNAEKIQNTLDSWLEGKKVEFYCSSFVAYCLCLVYEQCQQEGNDVYVVDENFLRDINQSPSRLYKRLLTQENGAFNLVGYYINNDQSRDLG